MKAVLEFSYPEDERKLLYALRGQDMYNVLVSMRDFLDNNEGNTDSGMKLAVISNMLDGILGAIGEEHD